MEKNRRILRNTRWQIWKRPKKNKLEIFFDADVGEDRNSHISAENYSADAGNSSSFQWQEGEFILGEKDWNSLLESAEQELSFNGAFTQKRMEILGAYEVALKTEDFSVDQGQKQAEVLLEELKHPKIWNCMTRKRHCGFQAARFRIMRLKTQKTVCGWGILRTDNLHTPISFPEI